MASTDIGPGGGDLRARLRKAVKNWLALDKLIKENPDSPDLEGLKEDRHNYAVRVQEFIQKHPKMSGAAVNMGFNEDLLPAGGGQDSDGDGTPDTTDSQPNNPKDDGKGGGGTGGGGGGNNNGKDKDGGGDNAHIVGKKGQDYQVVRFGGNTYVVYKVKVKGKTVPAMWMVSKEDLKGNNFSPDEGRNLTKEQFKRLNFFGNYNTFKVNANEHPFAAWVRSISNKYEGYGFIKNKEVLSVMLEGWAEGWTGVEMDRQVKLTKWFQNHEAYQIDWANLGKADQKNALNTTKFQLQESLDALYGSDWAQYVDKKDLDKWALNIASGRAGEPQQAFDIWYGRQQNKAEGAEGTPAYLTRNEADQGLVNSPGDPVNQRDRIFKMAQEWLGPRGVPANETLDKWADRLANGNKSDVDWENFLNKQKQALFPFLDDNETWQDRASSYRGIAEEQLGKTLNWDDRLFSSFLKVDETGNPVNDGKTAMSAWDFQKAVRTDSRWNGSQMASTMYSDLTTSLDKLFNATPYS